MNKNDIKVGLNPPSIFKNPIKWLESKKYEKAHKKLHNENSLFYPTTPLLLEGIMKAIDTQIKNDMIDNYAYYEFGVFKGFSLWFAQMYSNYRNITLDFYGFDSFEGLPESKVDRMKPAFNKGHYSASYDFVESKLKELNADKTKLFKGFYSKELFTKLKKENIFKPVSICVIDVDVYESHVEVLNFIKEYLANNSLLVFDDYNVFMGDKEHSARKALREFLENNHEFGISHLYDFGWHGAVFKVIKNENNNNRSER